MRVVHSEGLEGAAAARGLVVVVDVLRAFTVSACALGEGARECRLVAEVEEALGLQAQIPGALVSAEVDGFPVEGVPISNSPSQVLEAGVGGRTLVQRSSDGTRGVVAASINADAVLAAGLVVATATAGHILRLGPPLVTLVAMGTPRGHLEDRACTAVLAALLAGKAPPDLERLLEPVRTGERYRRVMAGEWPGFPPADLDLCLRLDRYDFAMPVSRDGLGLRVRAARN